MLDGTTYPFAFAYNDAGLPTSTTYSDGEVTQPTYTPQGWLSGLFTTPSGSATIPLFTNLAYQGVGGAAGQPTYATVGTTPVSFSADYNNDLQTTDLRLTRQASGRGTSAVVLFDQQRGFDGAGNVTSISTTLPAGTDTQAFCYDEQDRLTWASSQSGSGPCGGTNTAGTLTSGSAQYTQSFAYDALDRLTSGPQGSFSYGPGLQAPTNPAPLHGVVALGNTAYSYDPAGDRLNAGLTTGDVYDAERRLVSWATAGGTITGKDAYDGEGHRVAHQTTSAGTTTTTYYLGGLEEVTSGTLTKFEAAAPGLPTAVKVGTTLSYLASDGLGSIAAALDATGTVTAQQLYTPYGAVRYSSGSLPTTNGFTGQRADAASGLDYYNARYYDPAVNQFASADTANDGLNGYAYVGDNPETRADPTGHDWSVIPSGAAVLGMVVGIVNPLAQAAQKKLEAAQAILGQLKQDVKALNREGGRIPPDQLAARRALGQASQDVGDTAQQVGRVAKASKVVGHVAVGVALVYDFAYAVNKQYNADSGMNPATRGVRAVVAGTFRAVLDYETSATVAVGGQVFGEMASPVVGWALGGVAGAIVGGIVGSALGPEGTVAGAIEGAEIGSEWGAAIGEEAAPLVGRLTAVGAAYLEATNPWVQGQLDEATTNFVNWAQPVEQTTGNWWSSATNFLGF